MKAAQLILMVLVLSVTSYAEDWKVLVDLRGQWKFQLGDDEKWSRTDCNDKGWGEIFAPSAWEDEGYPGYDGYAWYRKHFTISEANEKKVLYLHLGNIDDVSEVYINGHFAGFSGLFPPHYVTAYSVYQNYPVQSKYFNFHGDNVIAVRVYDSELAGGIVSGKLGIFEMEDYLNPDLDLSGEWKLKKGSKPNWDDPTLDDSGWKTALVPAFWETQGLKDYDGAAWYRLHFIAPEKLRGEDLVLLLGKIDDIDEAYLNGQFVGRTGGSRVRGGEYVKLRAYSFRNDQLKIGVDNVLAVRVYDNWLQGGIYDGPIGLVKKDRYRAWEKKHRVEDNRGWNWFDLLFGN